jgi:glycosyltransferase involved in cell wall biosynthesis
MPRRVDHVTTNTYFTLNRLVGLGLPPERITYLSNGVDRQRFTPPDPTAVEELRVRLHLQGKQVVTFIGSLSRPGHPVDLLFDAFRLVHQQMPESVLLVVGGGDDFQRLQAAAKQMGLDEAILFTGRIPPTEVVLYYYTGLVSIDPVLDDDAARGRSPLKLFESWACGVPFVSCDIGDRRILLGEPLAGLLARPGDAASLAEQILAVLEDPALAERLRQRGLERVQSYYWDALADDLDKLYRRSLRGEP